MRELRISWRRVVVDAQTCERCGDTGANLERATARLRAELEPRGVRVVLEQVELPPSTVPESNSVLFNGAPLEELLRAEVGSTPCRSCCDLLGAPTDCRTLRLDGRVHEAIPEELLFQAGLAAARRMSQTAQESA